MVPLYRIAVLLTCHNRKTKTLACLRALFEAKLPAEINHLDVYLVDDGSTDGTSEAIKEKYTLVNIIQGNGNLFWNRGMHLAWETAAKTNDYDYYLWLNDDTILFDFALDMLLQKAELTKGKQILVGATCSSDLKNITYSGFQFYNTKLTPNGEWQLCDFFNGNIVLVPSAIFTKVGLLDMHFHHALGDFDYGMRATKLGFIHLLAPSTLGQCVAHETDPKWRNNGVPLFQRFRHLYSPLGNHPIEFFIFDKRHNGFLVSLKHFFTIHLRAILPQLWKDRIG